ncbi:MAG: molybdopterin-dependent oxidoreductase [Methanobacterium sp.]
MSENSQQPEKKKPNGMIVIVLLVLALLILLLAWLNRPQAAANPAAISIKSQGKVIAVMSMKEIQTLPKVQKKVTINSGSEGRSTDLWSGASMKDVLDHVDPSLLKNADQVLTHAEDGFASALKPKEIMASDDVLIAYEKNGELLKGKAEGGTGPFRLILAKDPFGNRMTKYLNEVELK